MIMCYGTHKHTPLHNLLNLVHTLHPISTHLPALGLCVCSSALLSVNHTHWPVALHDRQTVEERDGDVTWSIHFYIKHLLARGYTLLESQEHSKILWNEKIQVSVDTDTATHLVWVINDDWERANVCLNEGESCIVQLLILKKWMCRLVLEDTLTINSYDRHLSETFILHSLLLQH